MVYGQHYSHCSVHKQVKLQMRLTVGMLMVNHIQLILVSLHISQQIVGRNITALRLFILCQERIKELDLY